MLVSCLKSGVQVLHHSTVGLTVHSFANVHNFNTRVEVEIRIISSVKQNANGRALVISLFKILMLYKALLMLLFFLNLVYQNPCPTGEPLLQGNRPQQCSFQSGCGSGYWCHLGGDADTTVCCPGCKYPADAESQEIYFNSISILLFT